jgi:hypothetical protein
MAKALHLSVNAFCFRCTFNTVTYNLHQKKYCFKLKLFYFSQTILNYESLDGIEFFGR